MWSSILQHLVGGLFSLLSSRCKMKPPVEVATAPCAVTGYSALHTTFTAPKYTATVEDALRCSLSKDKIGSNATPTDRFYGIRLTESAGNLANPGPPRMSVCMLCL
jgi:hypothetical protein